MKNLMVLTALLISFSAVAKSKLEKLSMDRIPKSARPHSTDYVTQAVLEQGKIETMRARRQSERFLGHEVPNSPDVPYLQK